MARYKSNRSKATDFTIKVKKQMLERDDYGCIYCSASNVTPAHYISRGRQGLGILENGACVCLECHVKLDHTTQGKEMQVKFKEYLDYLYPDFKDEDRKFNKWKYLDEIKEG